MKYKLFFMSLLLIGIMSVSVMAFAGESEMSCEVYYNGTWVESGVGNGCLLDDGTWSGIVMYCDSNISAEAGYEIRVCASGEYCDEAMNSESYCAPAYFFKNVCGEYGGVWDNSNKECNDEVIEPEEEEINYVIGECPSGECEDEKTCKGGDVCVEGFYCLDGSCTYAGESQKVCEMIGGVWEMGSTYEACLIGDDETVGEVTYCLDETTAGESADYQQRDCRVGTYCATIGTKHYCAPKDYSEQHCEVSNGNWNSETERCDPKPWNFMPTFELDKRISEFLNSDLSKFKLIAPKLEIKFEEENGEKYLVTRTKVTNGKVDFGGRTYGVDGNKLRNMGADGKQQKADSVRNALEERPSRTDSNEKNEQKREALDEARKIVPRGFLSRLLGNFHAIWE